VAFADGLALGGGQQQLQIVGRLGDDEAVDFRVVCQANGSPAIERVDVGVGGHDGFGEVGGVETGAGGGEAWAAGAPVIFADRMAAVAAARVEQIMAAGGIAFGGFFGPVEAVKGGGQVGGSGGPGAGQGAAGAEAFGQSEFGGEDFLGGAAADEAQKEQRLARDIAVGVFQPVFQERDHFLVVIGPGQG